MTRRSRSISVPMRVLPALLVLVLAASAGASAAEPTLSQGNAHLQAKEYAKAADALREVTRREPGNAPAWMSLGAAFAGLGDHTAAAGAYESAAKTGGNVATARYNQACSLALAGSHGAALDALRAAVEAGFIFVQQIDSDTDLDPIRGEARFASILDAARRKARPCEFDERFRQLDYWVGAWDVFLLQGQKAGTNRIEKDLLGCLILESWTSSRGGSGKSMNFFDHKSGRWRQIWVDGTGGITRYEGEFRDGAMRFEGDRATLDGKVELSRMALTPQPDGSLRQLIEHSNDGGATWYVWFDGRYVRQPPDGS